MKKKLLYLIVNSIALIIAFIWAYKSNWEFEPIIAVLGFIGTLTALFMSGDKPLNQNQESGDNSSNIQSGGDTTINR